MVFFARHFCHAVPDATPVFTDWPAECKRQVTEDVSQAAAGTKILLIVGNMPLNIEDVVVDNVSFDVGFDAKRHYKRVNANRVLLRYDENKNRMKLF